MQERIKNSGVISPLPPRLDKMYRLDKIRGVTLKVTIMGIRSYNEGYTNNVTNRRW